MFSVGALGITRSVSTNYYWNFFKQQSTLFMLLVLKTWCIRYVTD